MSLDMGVQDEFRSNGKKSPELFLPAENGDLVTVIPRFPKTRGDVEGLREPQGSHLDPKRP